MSPAVQAFGQTSSSSLPSIAETNTPQIQALAIGLQNDPVRIFNYVHDHIRNVLYFGAKKGAQLTLLEKSGNDFDQSALLVSLLRAAGYTNSGYQFGWMLMPYDATDGSHNDLHHWLQMNLTNNNWLYTSNCLLKLVSNRGYPTYSAYSGWGTNTFAFQRVWVTLTIGSTNYYLDPAFKVSEQVTGINLSAAMGYNSNTLMSAVAGTDTGNYATNLNESALRSTLTGYTTNLLNYLQSNYPNASVQQILGGWQIVPSTNTFLSQTVTFPTYEWGGTMPVVSWGNMPTNFMSSLTLTFAGTNYQWWIPQLAGQRLSLTYSSNGLAQLWQDDAPLAQHFTSGVTNSVVAYINHAIGLWVFTNNTLADNGTFDQIVTNSYFSTNATYALMYAFEPDWGWLQARQTQLDAYRQQGLPDSSRQIVSETLNILGMSWILQSEGVENIMAFQMGVLPQWHHRFGRVAQENNRGYYVDAYMQFGGASASIAEGVSNFSQENKHFFLNSIFFSAHEHGIIEQLQNTNLVGASTVKMLQLANANGQAVYLASNTNWTSIQSKLVNYDSGTLSKLAAYTSAGYSVLLPQNGSNRVAGAGSWAGYGYNAHLEKSNSVFNGVFYVNYVDVAMKISGGYNGGYVSDPSSTVNAPYVAATGDGQPDAFASTPILTSNPAGADPVNMADDTFEIEHSDLSLGQAEPRGITLSRYYNGSRRFSNPAGMSGGWIHNYYVNVNTVAAPQAGLGGTTPAQAAPMIAAIYTAIGIYNDGQPDPKNWLTTALIAKWGIDQTSKNGVSVSLGKNTVQFVKQPNGIFTPPANCTMTLTQNGSLYSLQQRHGNTFNFDSAGRLNTIVDQYNNTLSLTYTNGYVKTVSDWKGRSLNFTYSGSQLASIVDSASRSVSYGYSSQGDLNSFTDPESKISTYLYDTNHQITATFDALSRLVVSNVYDGLGHLALQYTQGDTNKVWKMLWSGWQTIEQDPAGGQRTFFFDDQGRHFGLRDQLGNFSQTIYDGQNHITYTVSPLNEVRQLVYDGNHNVIQSIDPLGFTNQFVYDNQNNLIRSVDSLGNPTTFGYNAQFSLAGQTNGAGDFVNYTYNGDGTLHTRVDSSGTTTYDTYDSYGQLTHITYPNSLGGETFVNSTTGDPTSHTDANGNITTFGYNNRRQLTNSVAPTNLTVKVSFDAVGNVAGMTDARGKTMSNTWSATRHLLTTTLPTTPQGTPVVTNGYDNRDFLVRSVDPLQHPTLYTNDVAGRLIAATDPVLRTMTFGFDADGHRLAATNAALEVTRQTWDKRGSLLKLTDGAGHFSTRAYDAAGNQIVLTNRNGKKWQFQFDGANRLTNTITPLARSTSLAFNHQGLVATAKDPASQSTSFYYDAKGRLTNRTDNIGTTLYGHDANGNQTSVTENGNTNTWTYDAYNRASSYRDVFGNLIQYRYDASGNVTNLIYPGGKNVYYAYDSLNRMTNVTDWSGRKSSITYDLASHITSIVRPNGSYRTIGYDAAGQATNILEQMSNNLPIAIFKYNWTNSGSMAWEFAAPLPHSVTVPTRTMTYDDDNRLATFNGSSVTSDLDGNLTYAPLTNSTFASYAYDARNRLLNAGGVTNAYDAINNRIGQTYGTNSTVFVVNPNAKLPQVLMRIKNGVTNYYIYGAGLLYQITETATATNTLTYHYDYRGSTIALSADNGTVTDRIEYSAYGLTTYRAGTSDTPFLFNGRYGVQTDPNGLLYMRARYYNPYLCRFLNPDPSGFGGGLNHYAYANGNPISLIDPFGLGTIDSEAIKNWLNQPPLWAIDASNYTPTPSYQMAADMIPFVGDLVRGSVAAWNGDVATADQASRGLFAQGVLGLVTLGSGELMGSAAEGTMAVSPYRVTTAGETFPRFESSLLPSRIGNNGSVSPNTFAGGQAADASLNSYGANLNYNLPNPNLIRDVRYSITPPEGTWIIGPRPVAGGLGSEVIFPYGAPPGSAIGPFPVPPH